MKKSYTNVLATTALSLAIANSGLAAISVDFESYADGDLPSPLWTTTVTTGGIASVNGNNPIGGSKSLELLTNVGGTTRANLWTDLTSSGSQTAVSLTFRTFANGPSNDTNFWNCGSVFLYDNAGYTRGGVIFYLSDANLGAETWNSADLFIQFQNPNFDVITVGNFSLATEYQLQFILDSDLNTTTIRVSSGAGTIEQSYSNSSYNTQPTRIVANGGTYNPSDGTGGSIFIDNISVGEVPEPSAIALLTIGSLLVFRKRR